jgi:hypothetical protein
MEAIRSSETLGTTLWTTRRHIPEDDTLHYNHSPSWGVFSEERMGLYFEEYSRLGCDAVKSDKSRGSAFLRNVDKPVRGYTYPSTLQS